MSLFHRSENVGGPSAADAETRVENRVDGPLAEDRMAGVDHPSDDRVGERADDRVEAAEDRAEVAEDRAEARAEEHAAATSYRGRAAELELDHATVLQREQERYGGVKVGSAFFGWLTATGTGILLTALLAGAGAAVGVATNSDAGAAIDAARNAGTIGLAGGIGLLCILFIAYYCGGYVAGRMARFNGASQGVAVWIVALVIAVGVAVVGAMAGRQYDILGTLNSFPRLPLGEGTLTSGGIAAALLAAVVSLAGAVVGGLAGVRYHRKVDRAGLGV